MPAAVAGFHGHGAQAVTRLHGRVQRLRESLHECLEHGARLGRIAGLVIQVGGLHGRFTLNIRGFSRRLRYLLELGRSLAGAVRFRVRHR